MQYPPFLGDGKLQATSYSHTSLLGLPSATVAGDIDKVVYCAPVANGIDVGASGIPLLVITFNPQTLTGIVQSNAFAQQF